MSDRPAPGAPPSLVEVKGAPFNAESPLEALAAELTPVEQFYVRSNGAVPALSAQTHQVEVGGAVQRARSFSVAELRALGTRSLVATLECAGNNRLGLAPLPAGEPWSAGAVATTRWTGTPLRRVLEAVGLDAGAVELLFEGADTGNAHGQGEVRFARSLPREVALAEDTLLALEMDGAPLSPAHGAPLRLLVPSWYGMASVKWLRRIEAITTPFRGYYQAERYVYARDGEAATPVREMKVKALLLSPAEGEAVHPGPITVHGKAWSGSGEVARVEVAVDGGGGWTEATLGPSLGRFAWRAFSLTLPALPRGRHTLRARATDAAGNTQPDVAPWNRLGYGNNAVQVVVFTVR